MSKAPVQTPSASQPDHHPAIQDFLHWINSPETRRTGRAGRHDDDEREYISFKDLEKRLDKATVERILDALFQTNEIQRPDPETVTKHYLRPFAILLTIGEGHMIFQFSRYDGLRDRHLPFREEAPSHFPTSSKGSLFEAFHSQQWAFCAVELEFKFGQHLDIDEILPILHKEQLEEGGSAVVHKVLVDKDYDKLRPQPREDQVSEDSRGRYYVVKSYRTPDARDYYETEYNAFVKLRYDDRPPQNIIEFYGNFQREGSYNIILEYADHGTLDNYMQTTSPPCTAQEKMGFWSNFLDVSRGLLAIHGGEENQHTGTQIMLGWHQDINPWNILVKSRSEDSHYECDFKVADLGLSHFKKHVPSARHPTDADTWGTTAYGAPEASRETGNLERSKLPVRQEIDIWSMGCVYSEVAVWVGQGWNKLLEYRHRRSDESHSKTEVKEDRFHNGFDPLDTVHEIHDEIMQNSCSHDLVTCKVIENLIPEMLNTKGNRPEAKDLCDRSTWIVDEARRSLKQSQPQPSAPNESLQTPPAENSTHDLGQDRQSSDESLHGSSGSSECSLRKSDPDHQQQGLFRDSQMASPHSTVSVKAPWDSYQNSPQSHDPDEKACSNHVISSRGMSPQQSDDSKTGLHRLSDPPKNQSDSSGHPVNQVQHSGSTLQETGSPDTSPILDGRQTQSPSEIERQMSEIENEPPSACHHDHGMSGPANPRRLTRQETQANFTENEPSTPDENRHQRPRNPIPLPQMTVGQGLEFKKQKELGERRSMSSSEHDDETLLESLRQRDMVLLIDNSPSMEPFRGEVRQVLDLLAYILSPFDPVDIDLYFASEPKRFGFKGSDAALAEFDKQQYSTFADIRLRFANILEDYQGKYGKINFEKAVLPNSTPWEGPRKTILYVLTNGLWWDNITLEDEVKSLVQHITTKNVPNKHIGIQFIRFGNDEVGIQKLEKLDSKRRLGVELDLVDTKPADGNVWEMLLGPLNPAIDDDSD